MRALTLEEEYPLGKLIAAYRLLRGMRQDILAAVMPGTTTASQKSLLNRLERLAADAPKPSLDILFAMARLLRLSTSQFTYLLRAADYPPTAEAVIGMRERFSVDMGAGAMPAYLLDYHGRLWGWNRTFEDAFRAGVSESRLGQSSAPLALGPGMSVWALWFDPGSGMLAQVGSEVRAEMAYALLARWWRSTERLCQPGWGGRPEWLNELVGSLSRLPPPGDIAFATAWARAQEAVVRGQEGVEDDLGRLPARTGLALLPNREGAGATLLVSEDCPDARFSTWMHMPL
jgi:transcriptional regulator with XRE-family HTH domain